MSALPDLTIGPTPEGVVAMGDMEFGWILLPPLVARDSARKLLIAADEAEGLVPQHIYVLDCRQ